MLFSLPALWRVSSTVRSASVAGCLALAFVSLAQAAEPSPEPGAAVRAGTAKLVKGQVSVSDGSRERRLEAGDALSARDAVITGADGSASFVLRDGTVIVVGPSSRMELREFAFDSTTYQGNMAVGVVRGTMRMVSGLIRKTRSEAVSIETPTALIGIRGTDFIVDVEPPQEGS